MTDAWFGPEFPRSLAFLSLLSLLSIPAAQGRFKLVMTTIWVVAMAAASVSLAAAAAAYLLGQPPYVVRALATLGAVIGVAFGGTFFSLRHSYVEAELRKMAAADL